MRLHSIERNGDVLLTTGEYGSEIGGVLGSDPKERDLSWYGDEDLGGISDDGNVIAATQLSEGSGANYQTYFRKADGSGAVSLGEGASIGISPDGKFILSVIPSAGENQFVIYPTGPGESRKINLGNVAVSGADNHASGWSLDGRYISFLGKEPGKPQLVYVYDLQTNVLKAVSNQEVTSAIFSPDCKSFIAVTKEGKPMLHSISGDHSHEVMGLQPGDALLRWEKSGNAIFVSDGSFPTNVFKIDLSTGTRELWKHIAPADPIGVVYGVVILSPDGNHYAYRYRRILNHVYLATGLL
jgi:Tol biopolymer transport system component